MDEELLRIIELFDGEVTTADKIARPKQALDREMFDDFMKRNPQADGGRILLGNGGFAQKQINEINRLIKDTDLNQSEIAEAVNKKFPKLTKEHIIERLKNKVVVLRWILDRGSYEDRLHLEGYLIQRMKPLLNKANSKNREYWNHVTSYKVKKIKGYDIRKGFRVEHENINGTS